MTRFNELVQLKQKELYRQGRLLSDDLLARIYAIREVLDGYASEEDVLQDIKFLEKDNRSRFTVSGQWFGAEEIKKALHSREVIRKELTALLEMLDVFGENDEE